MTRVEKGQTMVAPSDGWFMTDGMYQRLRRMVADEKLKLAIEQKETK